MKGRKTKPDREIAGDMIIDGLAQNQIANRIKSKLDAPIGTQPRFKESRFLNPTPYPSKKRKDK